MVEIPGFPDYSVTSDGKVFSRKKWNDGNFRELKQEILNHGYRRVCLYTPGGTPVKILVSRLIASVFLPEPDNIYWEVRHLDGNTSNNDASNLAWGSHWENSQDAIKHDTIQHGSRNHNAILTEEQVAGIKIILEKNKRYPGQHGLANGKLSYEDIGRMYGVSKATIANIATRSWKRV